jgi:hypothetical protein
VSKIRLHVAFVAIALLLGARPGVAQVGARTVTTEEASTIKTGAPPSRADQEMKSPMLLEVPLKSESGLPVSVWIEKMKAPKWTSSQTRRFVVDKARVSLLTFEHRKPKKDGVAVDLGAWFTSEWYRQDLNITLALLSLDGKELARKHWSEETVGDGSGVPFAGRSKELHLETKVPREEWDRWASGEGFPTVRILVEVEGDGDSE